MKRSGPLKRKTPLKRGKPLGWGKPQKPLKSKAKLKPKSEKKKALDAEYFPLKEQFLADNPTCQYPGCSQPSVDWHHKKKRNGRRLLDINNAMAACRYHHDYIETHRKESLAKGHLLRVNTTSTVPLDQPARPGSLTKTNGIQAPPF